MPVTTGPLSAQEIIAKQREFLFPAVTTYYKEPLPLAKGAGAYLWDVSGRRYLDFFGGILTVSVGHCHPHIVARITEQVQTLQHTSTLYPNVPLVQLAEKMAAISPGSLRQSYFTNSGTEANETAILLARRFTGRQEIVALRHAYSGRSHLAMSVTGHRNWRLSPSPESGVIHAHNAYCYRCAFEKTYPDCRVLCARDSEELLATASSGRVAAVIAEPIQGVGGFVVPPPEYFPELVGIVRRNGGLFICDEVQTGFGRTGHHWFGIQHWNVEPDIMTCAKGMANGVPIGCTITRPEIAAAIDGATISTFGGNPVTTTAALATIEVIEREGLLEHAAVVGRYFRERLDWLGTRHDVIGQVRGMGLMQALELVSDRKTRMPSRAALDALLEATRERGLLIGRGGLYGNVVRLSPPLNITKTEVDEAVTVLDQALSDHSRKIPA